MLNDHGQVAFNANLVGNGVTDGNRVGVWTGDSYADLNITERWGDQPAGLPSGIAYADQGFTLSQLNNAGEVAVSAAIEPVSQPIVTGTWTSAGGASRLLAVKGYPFPGVTGTPIVTGSFTNQPMLNDAGQTVFIASADFGTGNLGSLWVDTPGSPLRKVYTISQGPGSTNSLLLPLIAANGRIAFQTRDPQALMSETLGTLQTVAQKGSVAPGTGGARYTSVAPSGMSLSSTGLLAFDALLDSSSSFRINYAQNSDGTLRTIARAHQSAPGTTGNFDNFFAPVINAAGHVAFLGEYSSNHDLGNEANGVWLEGSAGLQLIVRRGDAAPGASSGALFETFNQIQLNDQGQVLIEAQLQTGPGGVSNSNDEGLWLYNTDGSLRLIAREGDLLDVAEGPAVDYRQILYLDSLGPINEFKGQKRTLNEFGQVLFHAGFTDGSSGLFLTQPIPEPSCFLSLLVAAAISSLFPPRRRFRSGLKR